MVNLFSGLGHVNFLWQKESGEILFNKNQPPEHKVGYSWRNSFILSWQVFLCVCGYRCLALPHVSRFGKWTQTTPSSNSPRLRPIHGLRWVNRYRSTVLLLLAQPPSTSSPQLDSSSWLHFIQITRHRTHWLYFI